MNDRRSVRHVEMNKMALRLRRRGVSYTSISAVMDEIYGYPYTANHWRERLRGMGAAPSPRGTPFPALEVAA